jgi:transcriptional regulator with XRE-family HTH domain
MMMNSATKAKRSTARAMPKVPTRPRFADIGERLYLAREAMGMKQGKFAAGAGLTANAYNQIERGIQRPGLDTGIRLAQAYNLTLDWIYLGDPSGLRYDLYNRIRQLKDETTGG